MPNNGCECLDDTCDTRRLDGHVRVCRVPSMIPGFERTDLRRHLRGGVDPNDDGWIVIARQRAWVGLAGWKDRRRNPGRAVDLTTGVTEPALAQGSQVSPAGLDGVIRERVGV